MRDRERYPELFRAVTSSNSELDENIKLRTVTNEHDPQESNVALIIGHIFDTFLTHFFTHKNF